MIGSISLAYLITSHGALALALYEREKEEYLLIDNLFKNENNKRSTKL